ncbi:uncharacterized protein LOC125827503 [Solanum verrucosum]|uniref:uncharacterized protein LOC125827503 n=1 Tax=Solanum verrucosum TaxID=315347 RepID=UPI0020D0304C|nr:uncharacterized protein LOC125827503 [Solanum verrucosum]
MNPPNFTGSSVTQDPENSVEELEKDAARIWFDQWKKNRVEGAPIVSWAVFQKAFLGFLFPHELREAKVGEFLTLKQEFMSVHEYSLKFTQFSHYASEMVADMRSRMSLFVAGLSHLSSKEGKAAMLIGDMDISGLMIHVQRVEDEKLRDRNRGEFRVRIHRTSELDMQSWKAVWHKECGQNGHFMRECPKNRKGSGNGENIAQSSSVAPPDRATPRWAT